jgi:hypothetical protein
MALTTAIDFTYRYPFASEMGPLEHGLGLRLATCGAAQEHPYFFDGRLREPRTIADMLLVLSQVVRTHFFLPRPANRDPVVTSSEALIRFEGFSGCCGVYARADLSSHAFDAEIQRRGTTNVDFNDGMRAALLRIRDADEVRLSVGAGELALQHGEESVVEKKVKLPVRWIKGFSEVQAYQPSLKLTMEVPVAEARQFLRSLPRGGGPKQACYLAPVGRALRLSTRPSPHAVRVTGTDRLRVIEPLLKAARGVRIWADDVAGTCAWEIVFAVGRFLLLVSPDVFRGFSGEGQVLQTLAAGISEDTLRIVRSHLNWQADLDSAAVARNTGLSGEEVDDALAILGARGLAGYDITTGRYFHRELPFDLEQVESLQPRLQGARKLLDANRVKVLERLSEREVDVAVGGTDVTHHVRLRPEGDRCTCPWLSKHQGQRGPCKHILAARMMVESDQGSVEEDSSDS